MNIRLIYYNFMAPNRNRNYISASDLSRLLAYTNAYHGNRKSCWRRCGESQETALQDFWRWVHMSMMRSRQPGGPQSDTLVMGFMQMVMFILWIWKLYESFHGNWAIKWNEFRTYDLQITILLDNPFNQISVLSFGKRL